MAMVMQCICRMCNTSFGIYIPKETLGELMGVDAETLKELAEVDAQEEKDGEIETAKSLTKNFVDGRQSKACPNCGQVINFAELFSQLRQN